MKLNLSVTKKQKRFIDAVESDEYVKAYKKYRERCALIDGGKIGELRSFLAEYSKADLDYRRQSLLIAYGIDEGCKDDTGAVKLTKREKRILRRIKKMRAAPLTVRSLLSTDGRNRKSDLINPERSKIPTMVLRLLPTVICTTVTVSVMLTTKSGLDMGAIIEGVLKLITLPIVGVRGYTAGYRYTVESLVPWIETKTRILEAFLNKAD